jgi:hypothetical protein
MAINMPATCVRVRAGARVLALGTGAATSGTGVCAAGAAGAVSCQRDHAVYVSDDLLARATAISCGDPLPCHDTRAPDQKSSWLPAARCTSAKKRVAGRAYSSSGTPAPTGVGTDRGRLRPARRPCAAMMT